MYVCLFWILSNKLDLNQETRFTILDFWKMHPWLWFCNLVHFKRSRLGLYTAKTQCKNGRCNWTCKWTLRNKNINDVVNCFAYVSKITATEKKKFQNTSLDLEISISNLKDIFNHFNTAMKLHILNSSNKSLQRAALKR